jgi:hypothetical protein
LRLSPATGSRAIGIAILSYIGLVIGAGLYFNISLTPDRILVLLVLAGLATGRARQFLKDWSIFLIAILAWQVLQGLSGANTPIKPHVTEMINFDRLVFFGTLPTIWLQQHFYHPGHLRWYDIVATSLYFMHFIVPLGFAFVLWFWRRPVFQQFMRSFFILAFAGFVTFVLYPAAPPWLAGMWHFIPPVHRILTPGMRFFGGSQSLSGLYTWLWTHGGWDLFGAVPSEHAAFPFLCFLYARQVWHRAGWLLLVYSAGVWVSVVYLGEHYVMDVVVGVAYAALAYAIVRLAIAWRARRVSRPVVGELVPEAEVPGAKSRPERLPA